MHAFLRPWAFQCSTLNCWRAWPSASPWSRIRPSALWPSGAFWHGWSRSALLRGSSMCARRGASTWRTEIDYDWRSHWNETVKKPHCLMLHSHACSHTGADARMTPNSVQGGSRRGYQARLSGSRACTLPPAIGHPALTARAGDGAPGILFCAAANGLALP